MRFRSLSDLGDNFVFPNPRISLKTKGRIGCQDPKADLDSASTEKRSICCRQMFFAPPAPLWYFSPKSTFALNPVKAERGHPLPLLPPLISFLSGEYPSFFSFRLFVTRASKTKEEAKNFGSGKRRGAFLCKQTARVPPTEIRNFLLLPRRCLSENAFLLSKTFSQRARRRCRRRRRRSSQQARKRTESPRFVTSNNLCFAMSLPSQYTRHFRRDIWRISYSAFSLSRRSISQKVSPPPPPLPPRLFHAPLGGGRRTGNECKLM